MIFASYSNGGITSTMAGEEDEEQSQIKFVQTLLQKPKSPSEGKAENSRFKAQRVRLKGKKTVAVTNRYRRINPSQMRRQVKNTGRGDEIVRSVRARSARIFFSHSLKDNHLFSHSLLLGQSLNNP